MFRRPHHARIAQLLDALNPDLLEETRCYFAGGTAIVLQLDEYRESLDVDLLCASNDGWRTLRNTVSDRSLGRIVKVPVTLAREVRADRYGIRTFVEVDGVPIKLEVVFEARIGLDGAVQPPFGVPLLSRTDLFAEKLLANADRCHDKSVASRDIVDLAMMVNGWGPVPEAAWAKARSAYGTSVDRAFMEARAKVADAVYLRHCLTRMQMDLALADTIGHALARSGG
jgi:hypothetical protein